MYAMLEQKKTETSLFLRRYCWHTFMSSATKCKWMCWECCWNYVLLFCVPCHVDGLRSWLAALFWQPAGQRPVCCFLLTTLRIRGLEASQRTRNILLACCVYTVSLNTVDCSFGLIYLPSTNQFTQIGITDALWQLIIRRIWITLVYAVHLIIPEAAVACSSGQAQVFNIYQHQVRSLLFFCTLRYCVTHTKCQSGHWMQCKRCCCEPQCHAMAFALPVVQWCHYLFQNKPLIPFTGPAAAWKLQNQCGC